jgi:hypothetical protein
MIDYAVSVEDREKRTRLAKAIVTVMSQVNPQMRDNIEFKHKLWDHLFILSDLKLDVEAPFPIPSNIHIDHKPEKISYPTYNIAFKHYGNNIEKIIKKAIEMEDGPQKDSLVKTIANHLKKSYLNWNRESVTDEVIAAHLELLSEGKLKLGEEVVLSNTRDILANNKRRNPNPSNTNRKNLYQKNKPRTNQNQNQNQTNNHSNHSSNSNGNQLNLL